MYLGALLWCLGWFILAEAEVENCNGTSDVVRGCLSCSTSNSSLAVNVSSAKMVCSKTPECIAVNSVGNCIECRVGFLIDQTL